MLPTKTIMNIDEEIKKAESTIEYWQERIKNLKKEKQRTEDLLCDYVYRGFAISEKSQDRIDKWKEKLKDRCANCYIEYVFTPTELGTDLTVRCYKYYKGLSGCEECEHTLTGLCCSNDPLYSDKDEDEE